MARVRKWTPVLLAGTLAACGAGEPAPVVLRPDPVLASVPLDSFPPQLGVAPKVVRVLPEDHWREPFTVGSRGEVMAREPRTVVVLRPPPPVVPDTGALATASPAAPPAITTVAPADTPASAPRAEPARERVHEVVRGDTWFGIARRYGVAPRELQAANPEADPDRILIGQRLRVPAASGSASRAARTYEVRAGDTLWAIAQRHEVSVEALKKANRLEEDRVRVGQVLRIP